MTAEGAMEAWAKARMHDDVDDLVDRLRANPVDGRGAKMAMPTELLGEAIAKLLTLRDERDAARRSSTENWRSAEAWQRNAIKMRGQRSDARLARDLAEVFAAAALDARDQAIRNAEEFKSERDAAKRDAARAFDELHVALDRARVVGTPPPRTVETVDDIHDIDDRNDTTPVGALFTVRGPKEFKRIGRYEILFDSVATIPIVLISFFDAIREAAKHAGAWPSQDDSIGLFTIKRNPPKEAP